MRRVAILDTETDGTGPDARAIEVACIVYSVEHAAPIRSFASLLQARENPAEPVNGIAPALLVDAPDPAAVWVGIGKLVKGCDAIVAHNADFDRRFVPESACGAAPWICTMDDVAWPRASDSRSLVSIALAHGLGVASAHRALTDCDTIARLLTRVHDMGHSLAGLLARGLRPKSTFAAMIPFERNHEAKAHGFRWDGNAWVRRMAIEDAATLPFQVRDLEPKTFANAGPEWLAGADGAA